MKKWNIYKIFNKENGLFAGTTTKNLKEPYSYSLAIHTGENKEKIKLNRDEFSKKFPNNFKFVSFSQVHSSKIIDVSKYDNFDSWSMANIEADGMVTDKKGVMLTILTADCLGLLAYDSKNNIIGAAHAGWRGTEQNIAKNLINEMQKLGAEIENIKVALSPSIKSCCYEVGEDVAKNFFQYSDALVKTGDSKWHLDISIVNKSQLMDMKIKDIDIEVSNLCTSCQNSDYFSYRKECGCTGRFISYIGMDF